MQKDYDGYNYDFFYAKIYFSPIRVLKSKKKKLALTYLLLCCLGQETRLDDSWKLIQINQSRFYNLFHVGKFKNVEKKRTIHIVV